MTHDFLNFADFGRFPQILRNRCPLDRHFCGPHNLNTWNRFFGKTQCRTVTKTLGVCASPLCFVPGFLLHTMVSSWTDRLPCVNTSVYKQAQDYCRAHIWARIENGFQTSQIILLLVSKQVAFPVL